MGVTIGWARASGTAWEAESLDSSCSCSNCSPKRFRAEFSAGGYANSLKYCDHLQEVGLFPPLVALWRRRSKFFRVYDATKANDRLAVGVCCNVAISWRQTISFGRRKRPLIARTCTLHWRKLEKLYAGKQESGGDADQNLESCVAYYNYMFALKLGNT